MADLLAPNSDNLLIGKGVLYLARFATGTTTKNGFRDLGNCTTFEVSTNDDKKEKFSSRDANSGLLASVNTQRAIDLKITGDEYNAENMALMFMGDKSALALGGGAVVGESIAASSIQGMWYDVAGRGLTAITVKDDAIAATLTTDYLVDAVNGRIFIVSGGGIVDGSAVTIDYTGAADTSSIVRLGASESIAGELKYISDPPQGPDQTVELWSVSFAPDGAVPFITDDYGNWSLQGKILNDEANHPGNPYGQIIYP